MIFVDTSFWVALRLRRDRYHLEAARLLGEHAATALLTSNLVRGETWTFLRRRAGHASAVDYVDTLAHSPRVRVVPYPDDLEDEVVRWLRRHDDREVLLRRRDQLCAHATAADPRRARLRRGLHCGGLHGVALTDRSPSRAARR